MYETFYGLTDKPFQLNPDPSFYFASRQHRRAMAYLEYGLHQNEGFIVITGEVGAGKTTLVRSLLGKLNPSQVVAAQLVSTQLEADDTLRIVGGAFGVRVKDVAKSDLLLALEAFLVSTSKEGKRALLIVDEAQNLSRRAVEELRMLSNFQLGTHALLQSFLVGQPEFRQTMQSPDMLQLRQRVIAACHIGPMDMPETQAYIEHRLKHVGWKGDPQFTSDAYEAVYAATSGIPRRINSLCDRVLLSGYLAGSHTFGRTDVEEVAREMAEETFGGALARGDAGAAVNSMVRYAPAASAPRRIGTDTALPQQRNGGLELDDATRAHAVDAVQGLQLSDLEARLSRLERQASATIAILQQLLEAVRTRPPGAEQVPSRNTGTK